jgi:deoxyribodipyrimidine photolyase-related protein
MKLRLILGDQLNSQHTWFKEAEDDVVYVMFEMRQETDYVRHHIQKVVAFFLAMRAFAEARRKEGHKVIYWSLDGKKNHQDLRLNIMSVAEEVKATSWAYQLPDEWRLDQQLRDLAEEWELPCDVADTDHFLTERGTLKAFFGSKAYLMENFYRMMRKKYDVLMENGEPATGKWNYDHDNRKKLPRGLEPPKPKYFKRDVSDLVKAIEGAGVETIGRIDPFNFIWPVTEEEGSEMLVFFVKECLPQFGMFQDAMTPEYWSLFHSRLSFLINAKILHPLTVIRAVEEAWHTSPDRVSIAQAEGFIRQVLGWREYMRGIYWARMPKYAELNFFDHKRPLPEWYWTGETKMKCLGHSINQSLDYAYAHHIQRLMVTGNFALLAGIHPDQVDAWYLGIYIDAIEWVEITNTRGMSQFADGGVVGSKPYVSSGSYIHKMSHYCKECAYNVKDKFGEKACPFNSLYWDFLDRHREKLQKNPRMSMMYRVWDKMDAETKERTLTQAVSYLENINEL